MAEDIEESKVECMQFSVYCDYCEAYYLQTFHLENGKNICNRCAYEKKVNIDIAIDGEEDDTDIPVDGICGKCNKRKDVKIKDGKTCCGGCEK